MTSTDTTNESTSPPSPPPAEITYSGQYSINPMAEASFGRLCSRLPSVLGRIARMAWRIDRAAVIVLMSCKVAAGVAAAVLLTGTAHTMQALLDTSGTVSQRLHQALPALVVVALAAGLARVCSAVSQYAECRLTPQVNADADIALVEAVLNVEASALATDGFSDRQEAAEMGVIRTHVMITDASRFLSALVKLVTACGVLSVLHPLMFPLLVLTVVPTGLGALLSARVDYEVHYGNIRDRNVKGMTRWWATTPKYADEVRANSMIGYLSFWYRCLSHRITRRTLTAAPRTLRINLTAALIGGVCLTTTWAGLAWLTSTGRIPLAIGATAVVAVQTTLAALNQLVTNGAAVFHTSLYLTDMQAFLDHAATCTPQRGTVETTPPLRDKTVEPAPRRGVVRVSAPVQEIRLEDVVYRYPGKDKPAVDGISLTLRRGEILAIVGDNGAGKSTLTRLLTGIYLADKGRVTWNGIDLAEVDPDSVWECTALVPQIFAQWPLRARENVTLGQPRTHDDAAVWEAIDAVGMREAIEELPDGLDTLLAREVFGGAELSGGQWQRIACSRALYRKPPLLILDEPTSQMDPRGEHDMFEEVKAIAGDRITVMVTHRLENTKIADRILVTQHGRVIEQGRYDELVHTGGTFAELLALSNDR
ncbi:ABC transporter ATP-binding protein [Streptomyces sp. NBRC 110611]|uniref:ABC transporter ATP-binding protein n=1 Tax=Streptomyces sp. NBRC 110611 TaxID=1621259 RepID=UPI0008365523